MTSKIPRRPSDKVIGWAYDSRRTSGAGRTRPAGTEFPQWRAPRHLRPPGRGRAAPPSATIYITVCDVGHRFIRSRATGRYLSPGSLAENLNSYTNTALMAELQAICHPLAPSIRHTQTPVLQSCGPGSAGVRSKSTPGSRVMCPHCKLRNRPKHSNSLTIKADNLHRPPIASFGWSRYCEPPR